MNQDFSQYRSGYVAIVGWPNVGKSTLMNRLLGAKLSIVTPKPQTTTQSLLGILNEENVQMVFSDTPGWLEAKDPFKSSMRKAIMRALYDDADVVVWVLEARELGAEEESLAVNLKKSKKPIVVVFNKVDICKDRDRLAQWENKVKTLLGESTPVFSVSAQSGERVPTLKKFLVSQLPFSPPYYPTDQITDRWERYFVSELIRERVFSLYHEEVPHASAVVIEEFKEREGEKDLITASIVVETPGQKGIIIGKRGESIRRLGTESRKEIEQQLGRPVYLELKVKIHKNWRKDKKYIEKLGQI